jgi:predicted adenylyl cyclase CyaB
MNMNTEIKARVRDWQRQQERARELSGQPGQTLRQTDAYFTVANGRLKMRITKEDESAVLVYYQRDDLTYPKVSRYTLLPMTKPDALKLKEIMVTACGEVAEVIKTRILYMVGCSRIHFDDVERLGQFIEIEFVQADSDARDSGIDKVQEIMHKLDVRQEDLVHCSYADLILTKGGENSE